MGASDIAWQGCSCPKAQEPCRFRRLYIIGDSISAGVSADELTWPRMLAADHNVEIIDQVDRPGAAFDRRVNGGISKVSMDRMKESAGLEEGTRTPRVGLHRSAEPRPGRYRVVQRNQRALAGRRG